MFETSPATAVTSDTAGIVKQAVASRLEIFISYASEDKDLANVLQKSLETHLGEFAHPWIDSQELRAGFEISKTIKDQLDQTHILIIVYTGQMKESHGFTGVEVGYFMGANSLPKEGIPKRIVSFFLDHPPGPTSGIEGLSSWIR